jgi:L-glyceraldehyde 3-phosphate reductase
MVHTAFDNGITHFDLANNYGPPPGGAEETFGRILKQDLKSHRDEIIVSSKAGWPMWPGPYGDGGSRKYLMASLDQSLKRMGLDYVDIFYHHRPDPDTPLEESMRTLDQMVRQGKALYVGISSYSAADTEKAVKMLRSLGTPLLIHQPKYSMLERWVEHKLLTVLEENGVGCITFSSLAQGLLTSKYLNGIPRDSRAASARGNGALEAAVITDALLGKVRHLNGIAQRRGHAKGVGRHRRILQAASAIRAADRQLPGQAEVERAAGSDRDRGVVPAPAAEAGAVPAPVVKEAGAFPPSRAS